MTTKNTNDVPEGASHDLFGLLSVSPPPLNVDILVHWDGHWFIGQCRDSFDAVVFYEDGTGWNGIANRSDFKWIILPNAQSLAQMPAPIDTDS